MKQAIFDLDGTILDSLPVWDGLGAEYLRRLGFKPKDNLQEVLKTLSLEQAAEYFQKECGVKKSAAEIIADVCKMIEDRYKYSIGLKDGVADFLEKLQKAGIKMAIATATERPLAEAAMRRNGILHYFDYIFTCSEVGAGKDEETIYLEACRALGGKVEDTVVFEDSLYAIETAKKAGFTVVAVGEPAFAADENKIRSLVDYYIADWRSEMINMIIM